VAFYIFIFVINVLCYDFIIKHCLLWWYMYPTADQCVFSYYAMSLHLIKFKIYHNVVKSQLNRSISIEKCMTFTCYRLQYIPEYGIYCHIGDSTLFQNNILISCLIQYVYCFLLQTHTFTICFLCCYCYYSICPR
jgi:hypothetical protein